MKAITSVRWEQLADQVLAGESLTRTEALSLLAVEDEELLTLLQAAFKIRHHYFGKKVKLNMIINAKSGLCPEDCGYCSQSIVSDAPIQKYRFLDKETLVAGAHAAWERKAGTYCIVASGRGPSRREVEQVVEAVKEIKSELPLKICACLGILNEEQAQKLKEAGVDRYNHNLNTSADHHDKITHTHTYDDRVNTVKKAKGAGISPCSGCIVGMGESDEQIVDIAESLRDLDADSIPVNFLHAIPGTPLEGVEELNPRRCLKILALFRFINPTKEIRVSGGREVNLRTLQPLAFYAANATFIGDYLTTEGQQAEADHQMIADLGFEIEECAL
ncbi:biotin synthase BioB [Mechercharimyces sp. CAU 1602]|uniref:biotin synthase BioB n=1 Tax=Mechercharimyces sp. CAU 1602 TaxID=2973933 RepID=UPI0021627018|nr:biotin synthase BioB [Mechercharimyces sp. CAU 1602]MCS1352071.1 biotin synthase BioB [Mechercharimyces sp. CAU 1602]